MNQHPPTPVLRARPARSETKSERTTKSRADAEGGFTHAHRHAMFPSTPLPPPPPSSCSHIDTNPYFLYRGDETEHRTCALLPLRGRIYDFVKRTTTERDRSVAHVPSVTVSTSPSAQSSPNGFLRFASVCFRRAGGLGMYNTLPGRVRDGSFRPLPTIQHRKGFALIRKEGVYIC